jgi:hypothetical protein
VTQTKRSPENPGRSSWDNAKLQDALPFQMVNPGFNAILIRSCRDRSDLALDLGEQALERLWGEFDQQYLPRPRH